MNPTFKQVTKTRYVQLVSELAQEIFVQHYTKLTPKVAAALADKYQSDILTDDEIHSGVINYFLIYLGTEPVGYFALDLGLQVACPHPHIQAAAAIALGQLLRISHDAAANALPAGLFL